MKKSTGEQLGFLFGALLVGLLASVVMAWPVKWLWNWLCPVIFGLPEISAVQAWGLVFLLQLILPRTKIETKS